MLVTITQGMSLFVCIICMLVTITQGMPSYQGVNSTSVITVIITSFLACLMDFYVIDRSSVMYWLTGDGCALVLGTGCAYCT